MRRCLLLVLSSCALDPVDFTGHACPCAEGFVRDEALNRCTQGGSAGGDGVVRVETLRAEW